MYKCMSLIFDIILLLFEKIETSTFLYLSTIQIYLVRVRFVFSFYLFFYFTFSFYLCRRETISNDISSQSSTAKKCLFLCLFQCFIFGSFRYFANTHTHTLLAFNHSFFLLSYARAKRVVTVVNKGLQGVSFVRFFVPVCELSRRQNKDVLSIDFTTKDICNSLVIVCFLSLISRAGSSDMLSACREGEGKQSERKNQAIRRDK